jgi:hypothetical protein
MTPTFSHNEIKDAFSTPQVTHLEKIAKKICNEALAEAYTRLMPVQQDLGLEYLFQHRNFVQNFRYSLAKGVARTLAQHDKRVRAVYWFEPAANPDIEIGEHLLGEATIHLLVLVETASAALDTFVAALDRGLIACLKEMPPASFAESRLLLDVNLVTQEAVERRLGLANLLSSIFAPPLKLWERIA